MVGLANVPAASRSGLRAIVETAADEVVDQLLPGRVACNHGESGGDEVAHGAHGAGTCIGPSAASAVGSSVEMLHQIGRQRTPGRTHFDAARHWEVES